MKSEVEYSGLSESEVLAPAECLSTLSIVKVKKLLNILYSRKNSFIFAPH